ncbi:MAG: PAS domain S-box-containing protein [Halobacteriales archaeon]|jgi:PAS domain S-box-containing protein
MGLDRRILGLSVIFGLLAWVFDAAMDFLLFYEGTFLELALTDPPLHEIYIRIIIVFTFLAFGILVSNMYSRILEEQEHNQRLSENRRIRSETNRQLVRAETSDEILPALVDIIESSDRFDAAAIALGDSAPNAVTVDESGAEGEVFAALHTEEYMSAVFDQGILRMEAVTDRLPNGASTAAPNRPGLGLAITNNGERFGSLTVLFPSGGTVRENDVTLFGELAADLGFFLRNQSVERELRRFKEIVERVDDPIMLQDADGAYRVVNDAVAQYADHAAKDLVGNDEFLFMDDQTAATVEEMKTDVLTEEQPIEYQVTPTLPERGERTFSTVRYPLEAQDGTIEGTVAISRDVTESKQRERRLERYEQAVESSMDMLAAADREGLFLFANQRYREFHGLDPDEDLSNISIADVVGQDQFEAIEPRLNRVLDDEVVSFQMTRTGPNGVERTLAVRYYPLKNDEGTIVGNAAAMRDVTDRKERERQLETLISNLPGIVYRCFNEKGWPMETVRGRSEELTGYPAARIEEGDVSWGRDVIHPDDQEMVWDRIQASVERDEPFTVTYRIRTASGEERWVWEQGRAVRPVGAESTRLEGFITDISDRKQLEEDLRETTERYESLFTSIQDAILVADTDRRIVNCNSAFTDLFGYEFSDIEGERISVIYESQSEYERMNEALEGHLDDPQFRYTAKYRKQSGQVFPGETNVFSLRDENADLVGYIGLIRDVSDRERRDRQLKIIDRVLRHNINNDMNVINGSAQTIAEIGGDDLEPYLENITTTTEKLLDTVQKERAVTDVLLDSPEEQSLDLVPIVKRVVADANSRHPDAEITTELSDEGQARGSPRVRQAIVELIENAIVHSDQEQPSIEVEVEWDAETVSISVTDDGPGIPDMEQQVLTADADIEPLFHGSGLGLWIVTLIVEQSDGMLEFTDNQPRGSEVTIVLPRG